MADHAILAVMKWTRVPKAHHISRRQWLQGFALLLVSVFLLQTLAWARMPLMTSATAGAETELWAICTANGIQYRQADGNPLAPALPGHAAHCDLCVLAQGLSTAPANAAARHTEHASLAMPVPVLSVPAGPINSPQQARAPPLV